MPTKSNPRRLVDDVLDFVEESGLSRTEVGYMLANDSKLVGDLEAGRDPKESTCIALRNAMTKWKKKNGKD